MSDPYRTDQPARPKYPEHIGFIRLPDLEGEPIKVRDAVGRALVRLNAWKRNGNVVMVSHDDLPRLSPGSDPTPLALGTFEISADRHVWFIERVPNDGIVPPIVREPNPKREIQICAPASHG